MAPLSNPGTAVHAADAAWTPASSGSTVAVRLIAFNDFHGHLEPGNNSLTLIDPDHPGHTVKRATGGAAWLAGLIARLRSESPNNVVFSSGDLIGAAPLVSTLFRHESTIEVMNAIGLDFAITGNHEFDAGLTELQRMAHGGCAHDSGPGPTPATSSCATGEFAGARFPIVVANVEGANGEPVFAPTFVKEFNGIKLGFIGVVTRTTPSIVIPSGIVGLRFQREATALNRMAAELKRSGVQAIVAVVHEGGTIDSDWNDPACPGASGEIFEIARQLSPDIGIVFSAHTHQGYNCLIDTPNQKAVRVMQATSYGRGVSVVDIALDPLTRDIDRNQTRAINLAVINDQPENAHAAAPLAPVPADPAVRAIVDRYAALAAPKASRVIGSITRRADRGSAEEQAHAGDTPIGRLVADAQLAATRAADRGAAQMAFMNTGGIRAPLPCDSAPPCAVTYGQAFTAQPFGNSLVVMTMTGGQIRALLEDQQFPNGEYARFLQPSQGLTYQWKRSAPYGQRVANLKLDGVVLDAERRYRVTVNSFLAEGGDGFKRLRDGTDRLGGALDLDALVDYFRLESPVTVPRQVRITFID